MTEHIQRKNQCHGKNGYPGAISHNSIDLGFRKFSDFSPIPQKYRKKKSNTQIWLSEDHSFFHTFDSKSGSMKTADRINHDINRGVTILDGTGWYSKQPKKVLVILAKRNESLSIFRLVKEIDPHAFISQSNVVGVYGEGFDKIKG